MKKINLRELYPDAYTTDFFVNVTEDVLETIRASERAEAAYERKMYRYKAQYSLDCENGIENTVLTKPQTPEMVLEEKQLQKQVYFRHSSKAFFSSKSDSSLYRLCLVMSNLSLRNGRTPRSCRIHLLPSMTESSSRLISSLPQCQVMNSKWAKKYPFSL